MNVEFVATAAVRYSFVTFGHVGGAEFHECNSAAAMMHIMLLVHVFDTVVASKGKLMAVKRNRTSAVLVSKTYLEHLVPHLTL